MKRETLNKKYLLKITKLATVKLEDISELSDDIDITFLCKLIESAQKRLLDTNKVDLNVEEYETILKYICYTKAQLSEDKNSYKDAIDHVYQKYQASMMKKMYYESRNRIKEKSEIIYAPVVDRRLPDINEIPLDMPFPAVPLLTKPDKKAIYEDLFNTLKEANLLKYLEYAIFTEAQYGKKDKFYIISSAISQSIYTSRGFKSIEHFKTLDQHEFIIDIEEIIYQKVCERYESKCNLLFPNSVDMDVFVNYMAYLEEFDVKPRHFTNDMINKILIDGMAYILASDMRVLYYIDKLAVKTEFYKIYDDYKQIFRKRLDDDCSGMVRCTFNEFKEFVSEYRVSTFKSFHTPDIYIAFNVKGKINNIFKFIQNENQIQYKKKGFVVKLGDCSQEYLSNIALTMISLLIDMHNAFDDFPRKKRKRAMRVIYTKQIWKYDYFQICEIIGKKNLTKSVDMMIRNFCACRNALPTLCNKVPSIFSMIADINTIINQDRYIQLERYLRNGEFIAEGLTQMEENPTHADINNTSEVIEKALTDNNEI